MRIQSTSIRKVEAQRNIGEIHISRTAFGTRRLRADRIHSIGVQSTRDKAAVGIDCANEHDARELYRILARAERINFSSI